MTHCLTHGALTTRRLLKMHTAAQTSAVVVSGPLHRFVTRGVRQFRATLNRSLLDMFISGRESGAGPDWFPRIRHLRVGPASAPSLACGNADLISVTTAMGVDDVVLVGNDFLRLPLPGVDLVDGLVAAGVAGVAVTDIDDEDLVGASGRRGRARGRVRRRDAEHDVPVDACGRTIGRFAMELEHGGTAIMDRHGRSGGEHAEQHAAGQDLPARRGGGWRFHGGLLGLPFWIGKSPTAGVAREPGAQAVAPTGM